MAVRKKSTAIEAGLGLEQLEQALLSAIQICKVHGFKYFSWMKNDEEREKYVKKHVVEPLENAQAAFVAAKGYGGLVGKLPIKMVKVKVAKKGVVK